MLTLTDRHIEQLSQAELRPIVLLRIDLDSPANRYFCAVSGSERRFGYPNNIDTVTPIQRRLDREARTVSVGTMTVTLADDGWLRDLSMRYFLPNKFVTLSVGFPDDAEGDFSVFYKGVIVDIIPRDGVKMDLMCKDFGNALAETKVAGHWTAMHPLEVISDIIVTNATVPYDLIDFDSLDPSLYPTTSHFSVSRAGTLGDRWSPFNKEIMSSSKQSALDLVNELLLLVDGVIAPNEDGIYAFRAFDAAAAVVDHWTSDDIAGLEVLSTWGDTIKNRVTITLDGIESDASGVNHAPSYTGDDLTAQALLASPGSGIGRRDITISTQWLNGVHTGGVAFMSATERRLGLTAGTSVFYGLNPTPQQLGFCGCSVSTVDRDGNMTQESWRQLNESAGRVAYIMVGRELMLVKDPMVMSGPPTWPDEYNDRWAAYTTFTIAERAVLGTQQSAAAVYVDMTIPVYMAQAFLSRLAYGTCKLRVWTTLAKRAVQLGDFVSITDPIPVLYGSTAAGVDATTAWEVTAKDEDPLGDNPGIWWELTFVRTSTPNASVVTTTVTPERRINTFIDALYDRTSGEQIFDRTSGQPIYRR